MSKRQTELRLQNLSSGAALNVIQKLQLLPMKWMAGNYPGPMLVMSHRRMMVGKYYAEFLQQSMRKQKHWTAGEAELFASFTAQQLRCDY